MPLKQSLTTGEVAKYCGVNFRTVIRWVERGLLKAYELPGRGDKRIPIAAFIDFLQENNLPVPADLVESNTRILIVDDDSSMAAAIERVLLDAGFQTLIARDGFQAGSLLGIHKPRLVTLDLSMPGMDGFQVIRFIRNSDPLKHTKILVVSALAEFRLEEAMAAGADDVLAKPFDNETFLAKITRLA